MGEVYRARDTQVGREVAIKILPEEFARDEDRMRRFGQEARAIAALNHPNVVSIHDTGVETRAFAYLVSANRWRARACANDCEQGPIPARKAVDYGAPDGRWAGGRPREERRPPRSRSPRTCF